MRATYSKNTSSSPIHGRDGREGGGTPGSGSQGAKPQIPYGNPVSPGPPASMKKALAHKSTSVKGAPLPNKNTSYPGSR